MPRTMNLKAVLAAIKSAKTPAGLKKGLIKKYGHLLTGHKLPMSALATTVNVNPKKRIRPSHKLGKTIGGEPRHIWPYGKPQTAQDKKLYKAMKHLYKVRTGGKISSDEISQLGDTGQLHAGVNKILGAMGKRKLSIAQVHRNPKKKKLPVGNYIYVTKVGTVWYVDIPSKNYTGAFKKESQMRAFLQPALSSGWQLVQDNPHKSLGPKYIIMGRTKRNKNAQWKQLDGYDSVSMCKEAIADRRYQENMTYKIVKTR